MVIKAQRIRLGAKDREVLEAWVRAHDTAQSVVMGARIILLAAAGESNRGIAKELGVSRPTVILWRRRFQQGGPSALGVTKPGRGRRPSMPGHKIKAIVTRSFFGSFASSIESFPRILHST